LKIIDVWILINQKKNLSNIIFDFQFKINLDFSFEIKNQTDTRRLCGM